MKLKNLIDSKTGKILNVNIKNIDPEILKSWRKSAKKARKNFKKAFSS